MCLRAWDLGSPILASVFRCCGSTTPMIGCASNPCGHIAFHGGEGFSARSQECCISPPFLFYIVMSCHSCLAWLIYILHKSAIVLSFFSALLSFSPCFILREPVVETDLATTHIHDIRLIGPDILLFGEMVFWRHLAGKRGQTQGAFVRDLFFGLVFFPGVPFSGLGFLCIHLALA